MSVVFSLPSLFLCLLCGEIGDVVEGMVIKQSSCLFKLTLEIRPSPDGCVTCTVSPRIFLHNSVSCSVIEIVLTSFIPYNSLPSSTKVIININYYFKHYCDLKNVLMTCAKIRIAICAFKDVYWKSSSQNSVQSIMLSHNQCLQHPYFPL